MIKIDPFSSLSKTLRELGYKVKRRNDMAISAFDGQCLFIGTRREAWNWLIKTKQIKRPW